MSTNAAQELKNLEDQKANFTAQLSQLDQTENELQYNALKAELDTVDGKIAAFQQLQGDHEERLEQAAAQINTAFDQINIDGETFTIETFASNDVSAKALKIFFSNKFIQQADAYSQQIGDLKASYEREAQELRDAEQAQRQLNQTLKEELAQAIMDKEDAEQKRDAAVREIDDIKVELAGKEMMVQEKQAEIQRLRDEAAVGVRGAIRVEESNVSGSMAAVIEEFKASRPAIYNLHWQDEARRNKYEATLAETGEVIEFSYLEKGKYREVTEQEAERFRAEYLANQGQTSDEPVQQNDISDLPLDVITPPQTVPFPEVPNMDPANGLDEGNTGGEVVPQAETVSRAEFEALKQRVNQLEQR